MTTTTAPAGHATGLAKREKQIVLACALIVGGMVGMAYAAVPLYDLFCRVAGYGGTTRLRSFPMWCWTAW